MIVEQARIDAEFAHMEEDESYWTLQLQIEAEFAHAGWEALQTKDSHLEPLGWVLLEAEGNRDEHVKPHSSDDR